MPEGIVALAEAEELLRTLVLLESERDSPKDPVVKFVSDWLGQAGLPVQQLGDPSCPALVVSSEPAASILSCHLDTVPRGDGWTRAQGEIDRGRLYGRGAADAKAGCAAMLLAARELRSRKFPFQLLFTLDEETTMVGATLLTETLPLEAAAALVIGEPSNLEIVTTQKGLLQLRLSTRGRGAHAALPQLGENAIHRMAQLLRKLEPLTRTPEDPLRHLTGGVNRIHGGSRLNVVAERCDAELDFRYPPEFSAEKVRIQIRDLLANEAYELETLFELPAVQVDEGQPGIRAMQKTLGGAAPFRVVPYGTEMGKYIGKTNRMFICGPGDPLLIHRPDESVAIGEVVQAAEAYIAFVEALAP